MSSIGLSTICVFIHPRAAARRRHMSLYKRPRSPHWQYDVNVNGKRYRGTTRCDSKMAAKAFEARLLVNLQEKGLAPQPQRKSAATLLSYMTRFETWVR